MIEIILGVIGTILIVIAAYLYAESYSTKRK